ncbi:MAG: hypothetical protein J7518_19035 [Nocardioidaceae bacterium]|nr:hypothetical protein [Nocardioidaceae bacterium]
MIALPVVVDDHGALEFYESVERAESYLEAVDVANEEYRAYDAAGHMLLLKVVGARVRITGSGDTPRPDAVRDLLVEFLGRIGSERVGIEDPADLDLQSLAEALLAWTKPPQRSRRWFSPGRRSRS